MKLIIVIAIIQVFYVVTDARTTTINNDKAVTCFYMTPMSDLNSTLNIEDIDASICTHLWVDKTAIFQFNEECNTHNSAMRTPSNNGMFHKFQKLKEVNPELKLILQIPYWKLDWIKNVWNSSESVNITQDSIRLLKEMGFDGFDFNIESLPKGKEDEIADEFCELKAGFDKHGFILTTTLTEAQMDSPEFSSEETTEYNYSKIAKCCDHVKILSLIKPNNVTRRLSTLTNMLMREMENSSLEWTFRRDDETREPYAFTKTGLWAFYEDGTSMEFKANYVLEKGLGGIAVFPLNTENNEGVAREGRFPLTRVAYNTIRGGIQDVDNTC